MKPLGILLAFVSAVVVGWRLHVGYLAQQQAQAAMLLFPAARELQSRTISVSGSAGLPLVGEIGEVELDAGMFHVNPDDYNAETGKAEAEPITVVAVPPRTVPGCRHELWALGLCPKR